MSDVDTIDDLLPEIDRDFLAEKNLKYNASRVGADTHVVIHEFDFPAAYAPRKANLLIILPAGCRISIACTIPGRSMAADRNVAARHLLNRFI